MKEFNLELLKGKEVAVNCVTEEQAEDFIEWVEGLGRDNWSSTTFWNQDEKNSCYSLNDDSCWECYSTTECLGIGYKVISFEEALLPEGDKND